MSSSNPNVAAMTGTVPVAVGIATNQYSQYYRSRGPWSSGVCHCCSDWSTCCLTWWCPCITFGRITEIVDKGSSSCGVNGALYFVLCVLTGCPCFYSCCYRTKIRHEYMLEKGCGDCMIHCCCEQCALCQEYRELQNRGFEMSLGWHGNVGKQNGGVWMASAPVVEGAMQR